MRTIAIVGPLDTKGPENLYLKECIESLGCSTIVIDVRTIGQAGFTPDYSCDDVAAAAGTTIADLLAARDRLDCVNAMGRGAAEIVHNLYLQGKIHGVIAMGGAQTTSMGAEVMRRMPVGFPKVLVSTVATSGPDQVMLSGINDTFVINPLVDVGGLNSILTMIIQRAAATITGMAKALDDTQPPKLSIDKAKPCVGISMWGVTTQCVLTVSEILQKEGYQTLIFHATGIGGHTMETLIEQGVIQAVAEITLAEVSNPIAGGEYAYDSMRLTMAAKMGIPQVIVPGGCDMVKHMTKDGFVPEQYSNTQYYLHNPSLLFTRSSVEDNKNIGQALAEKLNASTGEVQVLFPRKGLSAYDIEGGPLYQPACDQALAQALKDNLHSKIHYEEFDHHINDVEFAQIIAKRLLTLLEKNTKGETNDG